MMYHMVTSLILPVHVLCPWQHL